MRRGIAALVFIVVITGSDGTVNYYASASGDIGTGRLTPATADVTPGRFIATGTYIGNGGGEQAITGLGFAPALVIVKGDIDAASVAKSSSMATNQSKELGVTTAVTQNGVRKLDADGFTVGNSVLVNSTDVAYYWVAFRALPGIMQVGSYVGDGIDDRSITGVGFQPSYLIVMGEIATDAFQRFAPQDLGKSIEFNNSVDDDNRIQDFEPDGFQIGTEDAVNQPASTYHYVAFAVWPDVVTSASYNGNDQDDRDLNITGFEPSYLIVKQDGGESCVQRPASLSGDAALEFHRNALFSDGVQALLSDGFQVGTDPAVNQGGTAYFYVVFHDMPDYAPVIDPIGPQSVNEGQTLALDVRATDPGGDTLILTAENLPANAGFLDHADGTGTFEFNPDFTESGTYSVRFIAADAALADTEIVTITVNDVNRPPVLDPISDKIVGTGQDFSFIVSAIDADGTIPSLTAVGVPTNASFTDHGDGTGTFDFNPTLLQLGLHTVVFIASDGDLADTVTVAILVNAVNLPPILAPIGSQTVREGESLTVTVSAVDPELTIPILSAETVPANATFVDHADGTGTFEFNPSFIQSGVYHVVFTASDGALDDVEDVTITVTEAGNQAPILAAVDSQFVSENQHLHLIVTAVDPDETIPVLSAENLPLHASFSDNGDGTGSFDFRPDDTQAGTVNIRFIASDGPLADTEIVVVTITNFNRAPVLRSIGPRTVEATHNLNLGISATDPDGTTPALAAENLPANAVFTDDGDGRGTFAFSPDLTQIGLHVVRFIASDGALADTEQVTITVMLAPLSRLEVVPDSAVVSADSSLSFTVIGYDSLGSPTYAGEITWGLTAPVGTINNNGLLQATTAGQARVTAASNLGRADTSAFLEVTAGQLVALTVSPDSVEVLPGDSKQFTIAGTDSDGNTAERGTLTWTVVGGVGAIDQGGLFEASSPGTGRIAVTSDIDGVTDTNRAVVVLPEGLYRLVVAPDTASLRTGQSVTFTASGFDANYQPAAVGTLTWEVEGGIGTIAPNGRFTAQDPGAGQIKATSSINNVSGRSGSVVVDVLVASDIPLGNQTVHANQDLRPVLGFEITNRFDTPKSVKGVVLRDVSRGAGSAAEIRSNATSIAIYRDADGDQVLSDADEQLAQSAFASSVNLAFAPVIVNPASSQKFFVSLTIAAQPRDGDSLDVYLQTVADIQTGDDEVVAGPAQINSLGRCIVDGFVGSQVTLSPPDSIRISPHAGFQNVLTLDVPRNGYKNDTLRIMSVYNAGTATEGDLDSVALFQDDGDGQWDGQSDETYRGALLYTGGQWQVSGIAVPLTIATTRFFIGVVPSPYAAKSATLSLGIPLHGVEMYSANDGPLDGPVLPVGTVNIVTFEAVSIETVPIPAHTLVPGQPSGPMLGLSLANGLTNAVNLDSLRLSLVAVDPQGATPAERDSQADSVYLWQKTDAQIGTLGPGDNLLAAGVFTGGLTTLRANNLAIASNGGGATLVAEIKLSKTNSKNGNLINLQVESSSHLYFKTVQAVEGDFPLTNPDDFVIDAFPAACVTVNEVSGQVLVGGESQRLLFDFALPRNGYRSDALARLHLRNTGSSEGQNGIQSLTLWADAGAPGFFGDEMRLGDFIYAGSEWVLSGVSHPLSDVTTRFFLTADIADETIDGATIHFEIPVGGARYASGTAGPDDVPIGNSAAHLLLPANRITAISIPTDDAVIAPGSQNNAVMSFALYNGYAGAAKTLQSVTFTNHTHSHSSVNFADHELGQVGLFADDDHNRILQGDTPLASGHFADGLLRFSGLNVSLAPESLSYFFVTADLPDDLIDGDSLSVIISGYNDFEFSETIRLNGDIPVTSGGTLIVDGSVAAQYDVYSQPPSILGPGDTDVPLLAFRPAINGYLMDTLVTVTVASTGQGSDGIIETLDLWLDIDGNGLLDPWDSLLSPFHLQGSSWTSDDVWLQVADPAPHLLVCSAIDSAAPAGSRVQLAIPVFGCSYTSDNDGPRDRAIPSSITSTISTSALRANFAALQNSYTVGQPLALKIAVTNSSLATIDGVIPEIVAMTGSSIVTLDSAWISPRALAPNDSAEYAFFYTAANPGSVDWQVRARSEGTSDSSVVVRTKTVSIKSAPGSAIARLINSIPTAVTRGLGNVFPLTLVIENPGTPLSSALRLDQIELYAWNGAGEPIDFSSVTERLVLSTGQINLTVVEDVLAQPSVTLAFSEPVIIYPGTKRYISLLLDIAQEATASEFVLGIPNAEAMAVVDANNLLVVPFAQEVAFPMRTAPCRIYQASKTLAASSSSLVGSTVNYGQRDVPVLQLRVRHPEQSGSSQIQLTGVSCEFIDVNGNRIAPSALLDRVQIARGDLVLGEAAGFAPDSQRVHIGLTSPLTLNAGEVDSVQVRVSVRPQSSLTQFAAMIRDSTAIVVRDLSSGSLLETVSDVAVLPQGTAFPMVSDYAALRRPSGSLDVCLSSILPSSVVSGQDSVAMISIPVNYQATTDYSEVVVRSLQVAVMDSQSNFLDPRGLFHRIGFRADGGPVSYASTVSVFQGTALFTFGDDGLRLSGGDQTTLELIGDFEAESTYDHFALAVWDHDALDVADVSDPFHEPLVAEAVGCAGGFPLISGVVSVVLPAGVPVITPATQGTRVAFPGEPDVTVFAAGLDYTPPQPQGNLRLTALQGRLMQRAAQAEMPVAVSDVFTALRLDMDGATVAVATPIDGDSIVFTLDPGVVIARGTNAQISIVGDIAPEAPEGNYVIQFDNSSFATILDENLATSIDAQIADASYPFHSAELSVTGMNLERSFSNYPNPFNPAVGEMTTIAYVLAQDADIDIRIYALTGEEVVTIASNSPRPAGAYQTDQWSGINDAAHVVVPGTYFCCITAHYASGAVETFRRKIAVVR